MIGDKKMLKIREYQHLDNLNKGLLALASVRPDAFAATQVFQLAPGIRQSLPTNGLRLLGNLRNMGQDGSTPGRIVRGPIARALLDAVDPNWPVATAATVVEEYLYDEKTPKTFYVRPPVNATTPVQIEASIAIAPAIISGIGDTLPCDDVYVPSLQEWMLYLAYAPDSEDTPNFVRAARHASMFFNLLGVKARGDLSISPKVRQVIEQTQT